MRALMLIALLSLAACAPSRQCFVATMMTNEANEPALVGRILRCDHIKMLGE